jgi:hypothetical protein
MLIGSVAGWFAWPAQVLLTYMLDVVNLLSRVPHVFQQNRYFSTLDMVFCYATLTLLLGFAYWLKKRRTQYNFAEVSTQNTK